MFSEIEEYQEMMKMSGGFVGLAQINPIAGNLEYNSEKIAKFIEVANSAKLDLIILLIKK